MSGADLLPAAPPSAVAAAAAAKVEPSADQAAAAPPSEQPPLEQGRQDEAMSVTTVPDEAVKQEAAEPAGADGLHAAYLGGPPQQPGLPGLGRGEVIMTPAQAKQLKLQKGYTLEPVLVDPAAQDPPAVVTGKRERKKSNHFGHSPDNEPDEPARPKAARPGRPPNGGGSIARPLGAPLAPGAAPDSAPWITEKKKQLQERLAKITKQLKKFTGPASSNAQGAYAHQPQVPASPGFWHHGAAETPAPFHAYGQAPASRSLSVDTGFSAMGSLDGSNGRTRDRKRPREVSESPAAFLSGKKPKIKKGQDRLAPTGKLRNVYLHVEKLLESLMKEKMAMAYFNVPVDPDALGIPQYREIIKAPMDLGTIKGKLEAGFYTGVDSLELDVYLVFDNAMLFNPPGTDVHECAKALKDIAEKRIKRLPKAPTTGSRSGGSSSFADSGGGIPTPGGSAADQRKMADMMRKMEQMQRDLDIVKSKGSSQKKPAGDAAGKKKTNNSRPMTFEEKRSLSLNINKLPHEKLGKVVEIIKRRRSNVVGNSEEIEIDIDVLDNATLKELDKYVKETLNPSKPKPAAGSKSAALQFAVQEVVGGTGIGGIKGGDSDLDSDSSDDSDAD